MASIEAPTGLPCPQASTVTPEERRLLSDGNIGPRTARTIELDERQQQTLVWMLDADQTAVFKAWWRDTLTYGGAWFSAPSTWPAVEGLVVKVRRFLTAPSFEYQGAGFWRVSVIAEVRGASELPQTAAPPPAPATDYLVLADPRDPADLTYGAAYLADFPTLVGFDPGNAGFVAIGSAGEIVLPASIYGAFFADATTAEGAAKGNTNDVSSQVVVVEFTVVHLPASGAKLALGVFSPSLGPPGNLDSYLLGFSSLATFWSSDGVSYGYGGSNHAVASIAQGDVIGLIVVGATSQAYFYRNGADTGIVESVSNTNALYPFASVVPN